MPIIQCLLILFFFFSLGYNFCILLNIRHIIEKWGLSWLFGLGWGTMIWFLFYLVGNISFSLVSLFTSLVSSNILFWGLAICTRKNVLLDSIHSLQLFKIQHTLDFWRRQNSFIKICTSIIIVFGILILIQDIFWPVTHWDALALYDFRAKVMVATGSLNSGVQLGYFFQYPLFTSMLHATIYFTSLGIAKIYYFILYQAFLAVFYSTLRKKTTKEMSIIGTLIMATSPIPFYHSFMAYTNLPYIIYACLGLIYLWLWFDNLLVKHLLIGSMLLGLSTWVRISEPFYYLGLLIIIFGTIKSLYIKKNLKLTFFTSLIGVLFIYFTRYPWDYLITSLFNENLATPLSVFSLISWDISNVSQRIIDVAIYLWKYSLLKSFIS